MAKKPHLNPEALLFDIVDKGFDLSRFNEIDDTDFASPPNFVEWILGKEFCDATLLPWQVEAGIKLFSDYCPACSNPKYLNDLFDQPIPEILDNITLLKSGVCPKCNKNRLELFSIGDSADPRPSLKNELVACIGQRAGKCLEEGTLVSTPGGPVPIEKLKEGDLVYGYNKDGSVSPTKVKAICFQGKQEVEELLLFNQKIVAATSEHRWPAVLTGYKRKTMSPECIKRTKDLNEWWSIKRVLIKAPLGVVNEPHAYVIGALSGDGCSRQGTRKTIDISSVDQKIPNRIADILGKCKVKRNHKENYTWHIRKKDKSPIHCNYYKEWCQGKYAHEKIIDLEIVKTWNRESQLKLLAGLLDTDGCICTAKNRNGNSTSICLSFCSQSLSLIQAFQYLFLSLFNFPLRMRVDNRKKKYKNGPVFVVKTKNNFFCKIALQELDQFLVSPLRKWKKKYKGYKIRFTKEKYATLKRGKKYIAPTWDIEVENDTNLYVLSNLGLITHNSKLAVSCCTYQLVRWLKLPDPLDYYGLPKMEIVLGSFSALSDEQAERNLWLPFKGLYENSPWFKKYNEFLRQEEKRLSVPLLYVKGTEIVYPHKRFVTTFTGSDDRKKRGSTNLWGVIDELSRLNSEMGTASKKKIMDADKNYSALTNALETIHRKALIKLNRGVYNTPTSIMYSVSSPYNVQDKIMRLLKVGEKNPWFVTFHRATWECNPDFRDRESLRISKSGLSPAEFDRDWGAIPPYSDSPFVGEVRVLEKISQEIPKILEAEKVVYTDSMGDRFLYFKAKPVRMDKMTPRLMAIDNGFNNNAFGVCLFRYDSVQKKPILDGVFSLYPDKDSGINIHFPMMFDNFILPVIQSFNIKHVFFDRWQSLDQVQRLRDKKITAEAYSLNFEKDLLPLRQQLISGNIIIPLIELKIQEVKDSVNPLVLTQQYSVTNLVWQILTVRQVGKKILKPLEGDDDLFRAFALGATRFLSDEFCKQYASWSGVNRQLNPNQVLGVFKSYGGGGSSLIPNQNAQGLPFARVKVRSGFNR